MISLATCTQVTHKLTTHNQRKDLAHSKANKGGTASPRGEQGIKQTFLYVCGLDMVMKIRVRTAGFQRTLPQLLKANFT